MIEVLLLYLAIILVCASGIGLLVLFYYLIDLPEKRNKKKQKKRHKYS
ncbi:hypothetical protein ES702_01763 [subsurface metagenome]